MDKKVSPTHGTSSEPAFEFPLYSQCISVRKDEAVNHPAADGEAAPAGASQTRTKVFLQDCRTGKFMRCDSTWSEDINEALDFISAPQAVFFGIKELKAEFRILQIGHTGLISTAKIGLGLFKWTKAPRAAHIAERAGGDNWNGPSSRKPAARPAKTLRDYKFRLQVSRGSSSADYTD